MDDWGAKPWAVFAEKAIAFRKAIGADSHPVIGREKNPQEWRDWYAYYGARKMLASQELMRAKPEKTVPTISPFDFDASFNPRYPSPDVPDDRKSAHKITPEQQERHAALWPGLPGNFAFVPMPNQTQDDAA